MKSRMLFTVLFWASFASMVVTLLLIVRRRMTIRLGAWTLFMLAIAAQQLILGFNFDSAHRYLAIEAAWAPWLAVLQAAAGIQAFAWLASSLVNFRKPGILLFAVFTTGAVIIERWTAGPRTEMDAAIQGIMALERGVGFALALALIVAWVAFGLLGAPREPRCHAFCLALLSAGSFLGWQSMSAKTVMLSVIAALSIWDICVTAAPTWKSPQPEGVYPTEEIDRGWSRFERTAGL